MALQGFLFAIVLASALTGAACFILCGPSPGKIRKKKSSPPGLINYGKSCFLNSILQAFAPCPSIYAWLQTATSQDNDLTIKDNTEINKSKSLLMAVFELIKFLNNRSENMMTSTNDVLMALHAHRWVISNDEQDAHEMFHVLTTTIEDELRAKVPIPSLTFGSDCLTSGILSRSCESLPTVSETVGKMHTNLPFRGLLASQLICESCSYKSPLKFDTFDSLSLSIPASKWPHLMLQDCLRQFLMPERVRDVECERCNGSNANQEGDQPKKYINKSTFIKQLTIGKIPDLLCIHIQRMAWLYNGLPTKRYEHVIFPLYLNMSEFRIGYNSSCKFNHHTKSSNPTLVGGSCDTYDKLQLFCHQLLYIILNFDVFLIINVKKKCEENIGSTLSSTLSQWTSANKQPLMYSLQSVIVHLGDAHSGHFVTYRRGANGSNERNRWYMCSDSTVYEVPAEKVLESDAYMLFYEKTK